ncbi:hypothetical protein SS50377_24360 [Spironucleus salmonicida]|uniref:Uncharacterized protein n=1 Tax=Spironucleus salmonicida TaxID=348837 RepID=V6LZ29_9EUKA|nr:hypothetical protein SS50377_24360 [Spironucleus salmonicida]|eukprot:EST46089.1 Hypothetical protein SS50377_14080 [Spironucleus salmonicida]
MFNQLEKEDLNVAQFITENLKKDGISINTLLQYLTNSQEKNDVSQKQLKKSSQLYIQEQYVKASNIAFQIQKSYVNFEQDYKRLNALNVNINLQDQHTTGQVQQQDLEDIENEIQLQYFFNNLVKEKKYMSATAFLHVIYNIAITSQLNFQTQNTLLRIFKDNRLIIKKIITEEIDFSVKEETVETIFIQYNQQYKFLDQHIILLNQLNQAEIYQDQTFTIQQQMILIAFNLNFIDEIFDLLKINLDKIDFYIDPSSASSYLIKCFKKFTYIVENIQEITQIANKFQITQKFHVVKIQTILANFNLIRQQISIMLDKLTEQSRIDSLFQYNYQVLINCQELLFKNQNFLRMQGYFIGINDDEFKIVLKGIQTLLFDLQIYIQNGKYHRTAYIFSEQIQLPQYLMCFNTIFDNNFNIQIDQYQSFCLQNCQEISEIIQKQPELFLEIIQNFLQNLLVQRIIVHAVDETERFVEFVFQTIIHFKFVIPQCHSLLRGKGGYGQSYLDKSLENCIALFAQLSEQIIAKSLISLNKSSDVSEKIMQFSERLDQKDFGIILSKFILE